MGLGNGQQLGCKWDMEEDSENYWTGKGNLPKHNLFGILPSFALSLRVGFC